MRDAASDAAFAQRAVDNKVLVDEIASEAKDTEIDRVAATAFKASGARAKHYLLQANAVDGMNSTLARENGGDMGEFRLFVGFVRRYL